MNFFKKCINQKWFPYTVASCSAVLVYLGVSHINLLFKGIAVLGKYFSPVITGLILAYVLHPLVAFFERTILSGIKQNGIRRSLAILLSVMVVLLFIAILMIALIPQLVDSITTFVSNLDSYARSLENLLNNLNVQAGNFHINLSGIIGKINTFLSQFAQKLPQAMSQIINVSAGIGKGFFNFILGSILALYFLAGMEKLQAGSVRLMKAFIPDSFYQRMSTFWSTCNDILKRYIAGDLLDGLIVGIVNWFFMTVTGMSYSVLISLFVGVTNLAPTFGPIVGAIIGAFILVLVNPIHALIFLIFTIVLQTVDGYIIKPKLFGNTLGVSAVWILVTLVVGGRMFGVAGIMLAIPFAAIFNFTYQNWIQKREAALADKAEPPEEE
ncbi:MULTISPECIES: AI-2E family transporter [unclassified Butyrivibrio]|uniref:AI-2E family transporter n=1 Tax=unclassified Butyrivibrio TaxID=2639466 RepID=UPI0003B7A18D|nr:MULTISPECIES: AI-2E family transporter [unclassified Butyrivibrio]